MSTAFNPSFDTVSGALTCNLGSLYSNSGNLVLGLVELKAVPNSSSNFYLSVNSMNDVTAPVISIPRGQSDLTLNLTDLTESGFLNTTIPHYQIELEFRVIEDINYSKDGAFQ